MGRYEKSECTTKTVENMNAAAASAAAAASPCTLLIVFGGRRNGGGTEYAMRSDQGERERERNRVR